MACKWERGLRGLSWVESVIYVHHSSLSYYKQYCVITDHVIGRVDQLYVVTRIIVWLECFKFHFLFPSFPRLYLPWMLPIFLIATHFFSHSLHTPKTFLFQMNANVTGEFPAQMKGLGIKIKSTLLAWLNLIQQTVIVRCAYKEHKL